MSEAPQNTFKCTQCGAAIALRALGHSVMVACPVCGSHFDVSAGDPRLLVRKEVIRSTFTLPLGRRGVLRNQLLEVVGAMVCREDIYGWEEYVLFNPSLGFRWLVHSQGHWNLGETLEDASAIKPEDKSVEYADQIFDLYHRARIVAGDVIGEFPSQVEKGDKANIVDYIAPPMQLSMEKRGREISWVLLDYLEPAEVEAAFKISSPTRDTVAPNQTNRYFETWRAIQNPMALGIVAAVFIQFLTIINRHERGFDVGSLSIGGSPPVQNKVFGPYTFTAGHSLNELTASAPSLSNDWLELNCTLFNDSDGTGYEFTNAVEFYEGHDGGGYWSEGSSSNTAAIGAIPAGTYSLVVDAESSRSAKARPNGVSLTWRHDIVPWRNFFLSLFAMLAYPGYLLTRAYYLKRARWADSEFDPYVNER